MRTVASIALACLLSTSALAQQPTDKVKLEVTRADLQIIGQGLMELPYKTSAPVLNTLQQQLLAADRPVPPPTPTEPEKKPADEPAKQ
jgi:hypothetical protein